MSLGCMAGDNPVRMFCAAVVAHDWFDHFILFMIGLNSCCMALERPAIDDGSTERLFQDIMGYIFTGGQLPSTSLHALFLHLIVPSLASKAA